MRPFRLRSRGSLILATVLLQAVVIGLGWMANLHLTRQDVSAKAEDRLTEESVRAVSQFSAALSQAVSQPLVYSTPEWESVQTLVQATKTPPGTLLFLLDGEGRVLCHPSLRR